VRIGVFTLFFLFVKIVFSQNCDLHLIESFFKNKQYALVYSLTDALVDCENINNEELEWAEYHRAVSSLELFNDEAQFRLEQYLDKYSSGVYRKSAILNLAKLHFRNKDYEKVVAKLVNIDVYDLNFEEEAMYFFRLGYAYFALNKFEEAKLAFYDLKNRKFTYSDLIKYSLAHIAYEEGNYASALQVFESLLTTPRLGIISQYYISHILYYQEQYHQLIEFAKPLLEKNYKPSRDEELKRLIGKSYFYLGEYKASVEYLEDYLSNSFNNLERIEQYQLALAYYELKDYEKASKYFEDIIIEKDSVSQFASYQLAKVYLILDKKSQAINAFKYSASIDYDYEIKEDAAFNVVKLIYDEESTYEDLVKTIKNFIDDYPLSDNIKYVKDLLIKAYALTKNYQTAIDELSGLNSMTLPQQEVYQKLSYYLAAEHFIYKRYNESTEWLDKSMNFPINSEIFALSYYWKAQSYFYLNDYKNAIQSFQDFRLKDGAFLMDEFKDSHYSLAYSYYQLNDFKKAILWFREFIKSSEDTMKLNDALLRLGDSYFMSRDYIRAQEFYSKAEEIGIFDVDYSIFQQIQCFGLINKEDNKVNALNKLIEDYPESPYNDDALLILSSMYLNDNRQKESISLLLDLIDKHPNSVLYKTALLKLGLNFYNESKSDSAVHYFKKIIEDYPGSAESKEALNAYKNICIESGYVDSYFNYVRQLSNVSLNIANKDSISYEASESLYLNQDYSRALDAFTNYLNQFELPIFKLNAHFYKAEILYKNNPQLAINDYLSILEFDENIFTEKSLIRLSRIEFEREEYGAAALHYTALSKLVQDNNIKRECITNLFYCYKNLDIYDNMLIYAKLILGLEKVNKELENEARIVVANDYYNLSEFLQVWKCFT